MFIAINANFDETDWSKVKCRDCGESGHGSAKFKGCSKFGAPQEDANGDANSFESDAAAGGDDGWAQSVNNDLGSSAQADWETAPAAPAITAGGW